MTTDLERSVAAFVVIIVAAAVVAAWRARRRAARVMSRRVLMAVVTLEVAAALVVLGGGPVFLLVPAAALILIAAAFPSWFVRVSGGPRPVAGLAAVVEGLQEELTEVDRAWSNGQPRAIDRNRWLALLETFDRDETRADVQQLQQLIRAWPDGPRAVTPDEESRFQAVDRWREATARRLDDERVDLFAVGDVVGLSLARSDLIPARGRLPDLLLAIGFAIAGYALATLATSVIRVVAGEVGLEPMPLRTVGLVLANLVTSVALVTAYGTAREIRVGIADVGVAVIAASSPLVMGHGLAAISEALAGGVVAPDGSRLVALMFVLLSGAIAGSLAWVGWSVLDRLRPT